MNKKCLYLGTTGGKTWPLIGSIKESSLSLEGFPPGDVIGVPPDIVKTFKRFFQILKKEKNKNDLK